MEPAAISWVTDQNAMPNAISIKEDGTRVVEVNQGKRKIVGG